MDSASNRKYLLAALLALVTCAVYWRATANGFVLYDDPGYVTGNARVLNGLTLENVRWAFTTGAMANWHPLTWLSHMLDCQLYGASARGHHLTSILLHAVNGALLLLVLERYTKALLPSAAVAILFALHPLHVESVAWISERKDVLSTFLFLLALWAYHRYQERSALLPYLALFLLLALGLLAKPMLVTFPFLLLVLDFWPLNRFATSSPLVLLREKAPLFCLSLISSFITLQVQQSGGAVASLERVSLLGRVQHALLAYAGYLGKMLWPAPLVPLYPLPTGPVTWQALLALVLIAGGTVIVVRERRRRPYLMAGWLWYLGTLVPVIGLVQVGAQAMADRYSYIPLIGIFIMIAWGGAEWAENAQRRTCLAVSGTVLLLVLTLLTWQQIGLWKDSVTLFNHTVRHTEDNPLAQLNLGVAFNDQGESAEALAHFEEALKLRPGYADAHYNLGLVLARRGRLAEALACYQRALKLKPGFANAHFNAGVVLMQSGRVDEALTHYREAFAITPDDATTALNLGIAYLAKGDTKEALGALERALKLDPSLMEAHNNVGIILAAGGRSTEAIGHFQEVLRHDPGQADAHYNLALCYLELGRVPEAVSEFTETLRYRPDYPEALARLNQARARLAAGH